jgi:hypothetical protein
MHRGKHPCRAGTKVRVGCFAGDAALSLVTADDGALLMTGQGHCVVPVFAARADVAFLMRPAE